MPWSTPSAMSLRYEFVRDVVRNRKSFRELCRDYGISEKTGHKWRQRFAEGGATALADRSHAPHVPAHQVPRALIARICALREQYPKWGARKLRGILQSAEPTIVWPAASTITTILHREGVPLRRRSARRTAQAEWASVLTEPVRPNDVWATDFKGQFRLGDRSYCYPLTVSDLCSRFVLGCTGLTSVATEGVRPLFEQHFREYGLPAAIRSDNGVPFSSPHALAGLSPLAIWWIRLGIYPERIQPGCPQQNGVHERMHRSLKAEALQPPAPTLLAQNTRFIDWRRDFNTVRPHEAMGNTPPALHYAPSSRAYPTRLPPLEYPSCTQIRLVTSNGGIKWRNQLIFLSSALQGEYVGLRHDSETEWTIWLGALRLGIYNVEQEHFEVLPQWNCTP